MEQLQIRMLGEFSLQADQSRISCGDSRSRKTWMLLAYLITQRGRIVPPGELIRLMWGTDSASDNPENILKVTLHRARTLLDKLWPGAGHTLILRKGEGYTWNQEIPTQVDAQQFEDLCGSSNPENLPEALDLYRGEFLGSLSTGTWVIPLAAHYHNLYVSTLETVLPGLEQAGLHHRIVVLCRHALPMEPYHEGLHRHMMRALLALDDRDAATGVYEQFRDRLYHDFGITPTEETTALWREASRAVGERTMPIETVLEHLLERDAVSGALLCSFDCFQVICHAEARAMIRSGNATHVALFSLTGAGSRTLSKRSLDTAMENLGEQIRLNLRRGDVFAKCSASQYVIMLPQANYENSCIVCRRLEAAFFRRYPHSPVRIHYMVRPLTASVPEIR